jgi:hypothetical protein
VEKIKWFSFCSLRPVTTDEIALPYSVSPKNRRSENGDDLVEKNGGY